METDKINLNVLEQLVIFKLGKEEYGTNIQQVKEILKVPEITSMPRTPEFISGIISLRGQIIPVINLNNRFDLVKDSDETPQHVIIVDLEDNPIGMIVDEVVDVSRVSEGEIESTPSLIETNIDDDYVAGIARIEKRLIILLDLSKVLTPEESTKIKELEIVDEPNEREQNLEVNETELVEVSSNSEETREDIKIRG